MKASVLDVQRAGGAASLDLQSAVLLSGYAPEPNRLAYVQGENRITAIHKGANVPKIVAEFSHSFGAVLDYGFDWRGKGWLQSGETITSSNWSSLSTGITLANPFNNGSITTVIVSGLTLGLLYRLVNTISTSSGRTDSRVLIISCNRR